MNTGVLSVQKMGNDFDMHSEIHLFIVWHNGFECLDHILMDLTSKFRIVRHFQVFWSENNFSSNMTRFYGEHLPSGSFKELHCGRGPFDAIIVEDVSPVYEKRKTSRGIERVNIKTFDAKALYRKLTGGGHRVHSTNNTEEALHDIWLLLHKEPDTFRVFSERSTRRESFYGDLIGADGWESLERLFETLNKLTNYVVLRNFECLPHEYHLDDHGDIDLLTDNVKEMVYITNAQKVFPIDFRVHYHVNIHGTNVPFDFRYVGDNYYDLVWERSILQHSIFERNLFYRPNNEDYFYSLLYHALIHKPVFRDDYKERLNQLAEVTGTIVAAFNDKSMSSLLYEYLDYNYYRMPRPNDLSVFYNHHYFNEFSKASSRNFVESDWRLLEIVRIANDLTTFSEQLLAYVKNSITEEAFSRTRHCLIRPLPIKPDDTVLEVGCGYGAISRYLGELGAIVTAVEQSPVRALIAAERCRDLSNVTVHCEDIASYETSCEFDWILLVGTLADAPLYFKSKRPGADLLTKAKGLLKSDGRLVIAIENKLGLKYFNGCAEERQGIPYYGIQGLYEDNSPQTYGRLELISCIQDANLDFYEFYFPFPDYRFPRVIIFERALSEQSFDPAELLMCCQSRDHIAETRRLFDDALVFREVSKNGLLADLSNSFLVVAGTHPLVNAAGKELAIAYAVGRSTEFTAQTRIIYGDDGINIVKESLVAGLDRRCVLFDGTVLENNLEPSKYVHGSLLQWRLFSARARSAPLSAFRSWFNFLISKSVVSACKRSEDAQPKINLADIFVPGFCLDMTPLNLVETEEGLVAIDKEWSIDGVIPIGWVMVRSIGHSLSIGAAFHGPPPHYSEVVEALCIEYGIQVSDKDIQMWERLEGDFQTCIWGQKSQNIPLKRQEQERIPYKLRTIFETQGIHKAAQQNHYESLISKRMAKIQRVKEAYKV
jgi:SAM-dependent methyltransferase